MKNWWHILSLLGIGCSSLCFLAFPLIALWLPASGFGWLHNETLTRAMLLMFLAMALVGTAGAFRVHRKLGPGICFVAGAVLLAGTAWNLFSVAAGWVGLGALVAPWFWDRRLLKAAHGGHAESHEGHVHGTRQS